MERLRQAVHDDEWGVKQPLALGQAVDDYLQHRQQTMSWNTWRNDRAALNHLRKRFGDGRSLHSITNAELQAWFDSKRYAPGTLALYAVLLRSFFDWAGADLGRPVTPVQHKHDPETLADDEIETLLAACGSHQEDMLVRLGLATGGRRAELWALEGQHFRSDMRAVRFSQQMGWPRSGVRGLKGKKNRTALVLPGWLPAERLPGGRLFKEALSADKVTVLFRDLLQRAGLYRTGLGLHILRHTYGRLGMEKHGWSIEMLRVFLGHQSVSSVEIYAHFGELAAITLAESRTYQDA